MVLPKLLEFEGSRDPPASLCEEQDYRHTPASPSQNAFLKKIYPYSTWMSVLPAYVHELLAC